MADEKTTLEMEFEEPLYIMAPHPEAHVVGSEKTVSLDEPETAKETLSDLIAVQVQSQMRGLRSVLQSELQIELKGEELNAKGKELPTG
jgi:hypothetical protein